MFCVILFRFSLAALICHPCRDRRERARLRGRDWSRREGGRSMATMALASSRSAAAAPATIRTSSFTCSRGQHISHRVSVFLPSSGGSASLAVSCGISNKVRVPNSAHFSLLSFSNCWVFIVAAGQILVENEKT